MPKRSLTKWYISEREKGKTSNALEIECCTRWIVRVYGLFVCLVGTPIVSVCVFCTRNKKRKFTDFVEEPKTKEKKDTTEINKCYGITRKKEEENWLPVFVRSPNEYISTANKVLLPVTCARYISVCFFFKIAGDHRVKWPADEVYDIFFLVLVLCFCWVNQRTLDVQCFCPKETSKTYVIHLNILFLSIHFKDFFLDFFVLLLLCCSILFCVYVCLFGLFHKII